MTYVNEAAQVFDIGKIKIGEIINKQSRQLTERERKRSESTVRMAMKLPGRESCSGSTATLYWAIINPTTAKMGYPAEF